MKVKVSNISTPARGTRLRKSSGNLRAALTAESNSIEMEAAAAAFTLSTLSGTSFAGEKKKTVSGGAGGVVGKKPPKSSPIFDSSFGSAKKKYLTPGKKGADEKNEKSGTSIQSPRRSKRLSTAGKSVVGSDVRRGRKKVRPSVEVAVATSGDDDDDIAAENYYYSAGQNSATASSYERNPLNVDAIISGSVAVAGGGVGVLPAPKFYEMTPQLLESLMAPIGLYQSPSEDGLEKELRLRMPVDYGAGCHGVCDVLFNEHLGVKIDATTNWMPVSFVGDYIDLESVQIPDPLDVFNDAQYEQQAERRYPRGSWPSGGSTNLKCAETFDPIASVLDMNVWLEKVIHSTVASRYVHEHDYAEPSLKFGRPRSVNLLQDAVSAFNKYVNFIRLAERREPFLFGLWWEKEDAHIDYWLLPKPPDDEIDVYSRPVLMPIANEWTEEVVVATEETVPLNGSNGTVTPMTFWDNRGFLSSSSAHLLDGHDGSGSADATGKFKTSSSPYKHGSKGAQRKRTTTTPVARAPRFLAPKLDSNSVVYAGKIGENGMPENLDELVQMQQQQTFGARRNDRLAAQTHQRTAACPSYIRSASQAVTATGTHLKNISKEKLSEIDFAMRCIKELQQRSYRGNYPLRCRICDREFTAPTSLIVHYRSHAGIKPFTCPICLTSFTRRHSLKYHMLCHSGQARFRCSTCDRLFRHSGHFRDHMRKHEHGMPFDCADCGRVFATRTTYRRHMAVVHNTSTYQKGKGRSVGISKLMGDLDDMNDDELGQVAEEIEYEDDDRSTHDEHERANISLDAEEEAMLMAEEAEAGEVNEEGIMIWNPTAGSANRK